MGVWSLKEPSGPTIEMQRGSHGHLLPVSLRQAEIPTASQAKPPHALGQHALKASALGIKAAPGVTLQRGPHTINRDLPWVRLELEAARLRFGVGTASPLRTACTVRQGTGSASHPRQSSGASSAAPSHGSGADSMQGDDCTAGTNCGGHAVQARLARPLRPHPKRLEGFRPPAPGG
jgi:hypothetical protein